MKETLEKISSKMAQFTAAGTRSRKLSLKQWRKVSVEKK